ncbi:MAG TPA: hypothetical protein VFJ43_09305, partial [Bacteroidia bacterium]|nr:hypothetical protein [Bacteroidia bacterium]
MKMRLLFIFFICSSLHAQQGWWTWMHGSSSINAAANYGVIGVAAATNNPPALYEAGEWTD